jgi:hypothetical protein
VGIIKNENEKTGTTWVPAGIALNYLVMKSAALDIEKDRIAVLDVCAMSPARSSPT